MLLYMYVLHCGYMYMYYIYYIHTYNTTCVYCTYVLLQSTTCGTYCTLIKILTEPTKQFPCFTSNSTMICLLPTCFHHFNHSSSTFCNNCTFSFFILTLTAQSTQHTTSTLCHTIISFTIHSNHMQ